MSEGFPSLGEHRVEYFEFHFKFRLILKYVRLLAKAKEVNLRNSSSS